MTNSIKVSKASIIYSNQLVLEGQPQQEIRQFEIYLWSVRFPLMNSHNYLINKSNNTHLSMTRMTFQTTKTSTRLHCSTHWFPNIYHSRIKKFPLHLNRIPVDSTKIIKPPPIIMLIEKQNSQVYFLSYWVKSQKQMDMST